MGTLLKNLLLKIEVNDTLSLIRDFTQNSLCDVCQGKLEAADDKPGIFPICSLTKRLQNETLFKYQGQKTPACIELGSYCTFL